MRIAASERHRQTVPVVLGLVVTLALSGCGGGGSSGAADTAKPGNDIAATDRAELADGGNLTWPLTTYPPNFNLNELDGALGDNAAVMGALMPGMFDITNAGEPALNTSYAVSAVLTATEPKEIVTYKLNPKAAWDDGTPIGLADFEAQWKALAGRDPAFLIASANGYEKIESVAAGADDREIVVTFAQKFVDWQSLFSPLYPASTNKDPAVFNDGWKDVMRTTAGPFKLAGLDRTAKTITLARNEKWWGRPAKLDRIIYRQIDRDPQVDALANGEIDFIGVGSDVNRLKRAADLKGVGLHRSVQSSFNHMTVNGKSPILADLGVRRALVMAINRDTVAKVLLKPLGLKPASLSNHIYMTNQKGYQDNSKALAYDPEAAAKLLDEAGWKLAGKVRMKDGKPLTLKLPLVPSSSVGRQISELVGAMLAKVGITLEVQTVPGDEFFPKYISTGGFDVALFAWGGGAFPVTEAKSIYVTPKLRADGTQDIQQNFARIGTPEIDKLFDDVAATFDPAQQVALGNQIDTQIWAEVHTLPFYQVPDIVVTKEKLANFGAFGFASVAYEDIGYRR